MIVSRTKELELQYRVLPQADVSKAHIIEAAEYPESEAGSLGNFISRQAAAPHLFLGCYAHAPIGAGGQEQDAPARTSDDEGVLVGYIVSTQSSDDHLTHESMSFHDPKGRSVCIHSVCVAGAYQRRGIASEMLKEYLKHLHSINEGESTLPHRLERVLLITHKERIGLYSGAGFELVGPSEVEHGPELWYEMVYNLAQPNQA
ncbi:hypothetical protein BGZ79_002415 [Entomortierella chlamydospora]|nr:hypothetical protein BGZ79_002415 [Entomortierella chlamydospora]